ncbi:MAG: hypothetical protein WBV68_02020, partial [Exiguobacterium oxidotolerans]
APRPRKATKRTTISFHNNQFVYMDRMSYRAFPSRLVFKAAIGHAATAKLQGRARLLFALKAIQDGLRSKSSACPAFRHAIT